MRIELIRCEVCKKDHDAQRTLSAGWITVTQSIGQGGVKEKHFCSEKCFCLMMWADSRRTQEPQLQLPTSKMRRFQLFTEDGDERQGVVCENGHILIDEHEQSKETHYHDWDTCKAAYDGGGVTWIDQEVSDASN